MGGLTYPEGAVLHVRDGGTVLLRYAVDGDRCVGSMEMTDKNGNVACVTMQLEHLEELIDAISALHRSWGKRRRPRRYQGGYALEDLDDNEEVIVNVAEYEGSGLLEGELAMLLEITDYDGDTAMVWWAVDEVGGVEMVMDGIADDMELVGASA